ncbi:hypothetical protein GCM10018980_70330 [Streptomyces capoamus]|uniref:Uncharacterized protein n=1 Tax=Streptomyces capoamus TaxID=68183 RepID=A0A919KFE0_9ACTN|nr:hypothetical protein GCM10010501_43590 [Streptomyces libani subsp. rufus]GHG73745.1 hypothetical protein GCM10018980_70330 [Streptomyces capoamus]
MRVVAVQRVKGPDCEDLAMSSPTYTGVSQETVVDSLEVRSAPPEGLQRSSRATMPRVRFL